MTGTRAPMSDGTALPPVVPLIRVGSRWRTHCPLCEWRSPLCISEESAAALIIEHLGSHPTGGASGGAGHHPHPLDNPMTRAMGNRIDTLSDALRTAATALETGTSSPAVVAAALRDALHGQ